MLCLHLPPPHSPLAITSIPVGWRPLITETYLYFEEEQLV